MTAWLIGGPLLVGLAVLVGIVAPRVAKRVARERRDAIERHSTDRGQEGQ
jgi:hypothetical protein